MNDGDDDNGGGNGGFEKVEICHEGQTMEVAPEALPAHYAHGDTLGPCEESARYPVTPVESVPVAEELIEEVPVEEEVTTEAPVVEVPAEEPVTEEAPVKEVATEVPPVVETTEDSS